MSEEVLLLLLAPLLLMLFVHASYVYVMSFKKLRDEEKLNPFVLCFFWSTVVVMLPFYWLLNLTLASVLFLELPRSLAFTERCKRHIKKGKGWRYRQAKWWCDKFLNPFDPGHCGY